MHVATAGRRKHCSPMRNKKTSSIHRQSHPHFQVKEHKPLFWPRPKVNWQEPKSLQEEEKKNTQMLNEVQRQWRDYKSPPPHMSIWKRSIPPNHRCYHGPELRIKMLLKQEQTSNEWIETEEMYMRRSTKTGTSVLIDSCERQDPKLMALTPSEIQIQSCFRKLGMSNVLGTRFKDLE